MWNPFATKPAPVDPRDAKIADLITERDALRGFITNKDKRIDSLVEDNTTLANANSALDRVCKKYKAERDEARAALATANAELATLRAGKAKRVANLTAANKARAEAAAANRAGAELASVA